MAEPPNRQKILIVEDDRNIASLVEQYLVREGFAVLRAADGPAGLAAARREKPALVILDVMLPGKDGWEVCRELRRDSDLPILMLTARADEMDRVVGLSIGADDYVVKPFSPQELVSRARAVLRRTRGSAPGIGDQPLVYGELRIEPQARLVEVAGQEKTLTAKEFDLLWTMARHPRQVFSRDQLLDLVWGLTEYIDPSTVTVHVRRLREKIETDPGSPRYIQTVWGVGYKFEP